MLLHGDCIEKLKTLPDCSVDAVVTDPPYGLAFMGKRWDYDVPTVEVWVECLRVLKPGGHLLAFAGTRTQHRMAVRIEDAGFEIRDMIAWVYGSGFPKSLDVSKAIDKAAGAERQATGRILSVTGNRANGSSALAKSGLGAVGVGPQLHMETAPATEAARQWQGWGTALKPALETVTFASKPYTDEQERDIILSNLIRLEARLWLLSSASAAARSSASSQNEHGAACAIAQWSAEEVTNTRAALCDLMGTSLFESATNTSLSIVSSWRRILAESWSDGSMSTTETKSSTTTDLRTLKFSLSQITPASIIKACSLPGGFSANASTAESHFNASVSLLQSIRTLSATEPAISLEAENCRGAGVKPSLDPCIMARKPLIGTVAENVLKYGTGAINIDACRVGFQGEADKAAAAAAAAQRSCQDQNKNRTAYGKFNNGAASLEPYLNGMDKGRWPANLIHSGEPEVVELFPQTKSGNLNQASVKAADRIYGGGFGNGKTNPRLFQANEGSAARFFYCAKASKADRDEGCEGLEYRTAGEMVDREEGSAGINNPRAGAGRTGGARNHHPTVKPVSLMRYLCRLVTPPGGIVLDPFMGSGSTGKGAVLEGFRFIGIERDPDYIQIAESRIKHAQEQAMEAEQMPQQLELEVASA